MTSTRTLVGYGALLAIALNVAPAFSPAGMAPVRLNTPEQAQAAAESTLYAPTDPTTTLADAATVATLTDGRSCDAPATLTEQGIIPTLVVIRPADGSPVTAVDLATALDASAQGTAYVVTACV